MFAAAGVRETGRRASLTRGTALSLARGTPSPRTGTDKHLRGRNRCLARRAGRQETAGRRRPPPPPVARAPPRLPPVAKLAPRYGLDRRPVLRPPAAPPPRRGGAR